MLLCIRRGIEGVGREVQALMPSLGRFVVVAMVVVVMVVVMLILVVMMMVVVVMVAMRCLGRRG